MRLIKKDEDTDLYSIVQNDGMRAVNIKFNGVYIKTFNKAQSQEIEFGGWRVFTLHEIRAYQGWITIRESKKLKVLKGALK